MNLEIKNSNQFGSISNQDIIDLEKRISKKLPEDYKIFLLTHNGGKPRQDFFKYKRGKIESEFSVSYFFGLHDGEYWAKLDYAIEHLTGQIPIEFLPIANDGGGNYYVLNLSKEKHGKVYFWDHNTARKGIKNYRNMKVLAKSFTDFISKMEEDDDDFDVTIRIEGDDIIIE